MQRDAMSFKKGQSGNPSGKKKGTLNKSTQEARAAIAAFVDGNAHRLTGWLDKIAEDDPAKAFALFQSVIEYHVPKLARQEIAGDKDNPVQHNLTVRVVE